MYYKQKVLTKVNSIQIKYLNWIPLLIEILFLVRTKIRFLFLTFAKKKKKKVICLKTSCYVKIINFIMFKISPNYYYYYYYLKVIFDSMKIGYIIKIDF